MRRITAIATLILAAHAWGQSFNIDVDLPAGYVGTGVPANAFGGAADQPGFWNGIVNPIGSSYTLKNLNGVTTAVTLQTSGLATYHSFNDGSATGDYAKLMEDTWEVAEANASMTFVFNGLQAGSYFLYTFADDPASTSAETRVTVNGQTQTVGGSHGTNQFFTPVTHARHMIQLARGQSLTVTISNNTNVASARGVICGFQVQTLPTRLYVNDDAAPGGDGTTWPTAFQRLQDAFDAVPSYGGAIEEIWVAGGTYIPADVAFRGDTFDLPDAVAVYGGFAGTETQLSQRVLGSSPSFLSGSIGAPGIADNSYHVVTAWGCGYDTVLDGFTIAGGNANGTLGWDMHGGAMFIRESELTVRNCSFVGNYGWRGGAVAVQDATPRLENCYFFNNTAEQTGGGVFTLTGGAPKIVDCDFRLNHATVNYGGAVAHYDGTNMYVFNCRFMDNDAGWGGGGIFTASGNCTVANCIFTANTGDADRGGAIHTFGDCYLFVYNSTIVANQAYECGGIDAFAGANVFVRNSIIYGNTDEDPNTSSERAQLFEHSDSAMTVAYCDVQGWTGILGGQGNFDAIPQFVDSNGADNVPGTLDDDFRLLPNSPCIDRGSNSLLPSDGADVDNDNNLIEPLPIDLDGNARRLDDPATPDSGSGTAPVVDVGAYEFSAAACDPCDTNCDGSMNGFDIQPFIDVMVGGSGCSACSGDANEDGSVNAFDIQPFMECLGG